MLAFWNSLDTTIKPAAIGAIATFLAAVFGFGGVICTINAQGNQSRSAIAENERRRIKSLMYEDALGICRVMVDAAITLSNELRMMKLQVATVSQAAEHGLPYGIPAARYPALSSSYAHFADAAIKTINLIENRLIIDPRLLIFRTAFSTVLHDTRNLMYNEFVVYVMPSIPTDNPAGGIFPYTPPPSVRVQDIDRLSEKFIDALGDSVAYSEDFLVELQNLLLGDLFGNKVPSRQPIDPSKRAVMLEKAEELEKWFRSSTAWGKDMAEVEARTVAQFSGVNDQRKNG